MWGFCGIAGLLSLLLTFLFSLAYFRSQFGPFCNEKNWISGLINIRVHQLLVISAGTMASFALGKAGSIMLQRWFLTDRMKKKVANISKRTKEKRKQQSVEAIEKPNDCWSDSDQGSSLMSVDPAPRQASNETKKVLICHASVGSTSTHAAEAIEEALRELRPDIEVKTIDLMDPQFADRAFTYFYKDYYLHLVAGQTAFGKLGNKFASFFFDKSNYVEKDSGSTYFNNRRFLMNMTLNFLDFVCEFDPDLIISTQFLAPEIIAGLRRDFEEIQYPHVTIITEMDVHSIWYQQPCEKYFVARDLCRYQLELHGAQTDQILVSGIPIRPSFSTVLRETEKSSLSERRDRFYSRFDRNVTLWDSPRDSRPIVLLLGSAPNTVQLYRHLLRLGTPCIFVTIYFEEYCRQQLEEIKVPLPHKSVMIDFTNQMPELMAVADVIITQPGGSITSEALACGLMMVIVDIATKQEERNASVLLEAGAAIQVHNPNVLPFRLEPILHKPQELTKFKKNSKELGRPDAAHQIVRCCRVFF